MIKKVGDILFYLLLGGIIVYFGAKLYFRFSSSEKGESAPDFETELIDGSTFNLISLKGEWVLLDFWGSWCGPCIREVPDLLAFHELYKDDVILVTIGLEKNKAAGINASKSFGFNWKYQIIEENKFVMLSSIAQKYGITDIPAKVLIAPDGSFNKIDLFSDVETYINQSK